MTDASRINQAITLLRAAYGHVEVPNDEATWYRFLRVLMGISIDHPANGALSELLQSSSLATPRESEAASAGQLVELLKPIPRGPQKASVVRAVAAWWLSQFGDERSPAWSGGVATY